MRTDPWRGRAAAVAVGVGGSAVFVALGLPLPLLLGPMLGCLAAALVGVRMAGMGVLSDFMRTFLGLAVGTSITPAVVGQLPGMAASLVFVPLFIAVIGAVGYPLFRWGFRFDHPTAWYGAMPGGLQDMILFGEEAGGDARALSLIHATRVLIIVSVAPVIMAAYWAVDLTGAPGRSAVSMDPAQLGWMLFAAFAGWRIAARVGLFGASILGPMILAAILTLAGLIDSRPPAELIWAAQFFIGIGLGVKYTGITARELRTIVGAGIVYSLLLAAISLVFFEIVYQTGQAPALDAFLAFLPGGQAEMVVIAIMVGADLAYVVSHHLLRVILVILLAPVVARLFRAPR